MQGLKGRLRLLWLKLCSYFKVLGQWRSETFVLWFTQGPAGMWRTQRLSLGSLTPSPGLWATSHSFHQNLACINITQSCLRIYVNTFCASLWMEICVAKQGKWVRQRMGRYGIWPVFLRLKNKNKKSRTYMASKRYFKPWRLLGALVLSGKKCEEVERKGKCIPEKF